MKMMLAGMALAGMMVALTAWAGGELARGEDAAQDTVSIGVDADPTGNTATSLGPIDSCISVSSGETFQVDVFVTDVRDLLAWETYFAYDITIINVLDRDATIFQAANPGSNVFDASEGLPDLDGLYGVGAADISEPPAVDSGSGVLARLTLKAVGAGVSPADLSPIDFNNDGAVDLGPFLRDDRDNYVGDLNGDTYFDGYIANARIAVDMPCPSGAPVGSPTAPGVSPSPTAPLPSPLTSPTATAALASPTPAASPLPGDKGSTWTSGPWIGGYAAAGLAALVLATIALLTIRRRGGG